MSSRPYVCLYVSQLAACLGLDRFRSVDQALEAVWKRLDPWAVKQAYLRCGKVSQVDSVKAAIERDPDIVSAVNTFVEGIDTSDSDKTQRMANALANDYGSKYGTNTHDIQQEIRSKIYTTYGTASEGRVFETINTRELFPVPIVKDDALYSMPMGTVSGVVWHVGGRIDAALADRSAVVEIKNRIYRLYRHIRHHDMMQVQGYMQLLNVRRGFLVECLSRNNEMELCVIGTHRDDAMWANFVVPRLTAFVTVLMDVVNDVRKQDVLVGSEHRTSVVTSWLHEHMR